MSENIIAKLIIIDQFSNDIMYQFLHNSESFSLL